MQIKSVKIIAGKICTEILKFSFVLYSRLTIYTNTIKPKDYQNHKRRQ